MTSHAWALLKNGPLDVHVSISAPIPLRDFKDRKDLARYAEQEIRTNVVRHLRGRADDERLMAASAPSSWTRAQLSPSNADKNATWV